MLHCILSLKTDYNYIVFKCANFFFKANNGKILQILQQNLANFIRVSSEDRSELLYK